MERGLGVRVLTYLGNISPPTLFPRCPTFSSPLRSDVPTSQLSQRVRCVTRYQTGSLCVRVCVWGGGIAYWPLAHVHEFEAK